MTAMETCKHNFKPQAGVPTDGCVECVIENEKRLEKSLKNAVKKPKRELPSGLACAGWGGFL